MINILLLVTYDVSTENVKGKARLRKVAKICTDYGQRVQDSVFECLIDSSQFLVMKDKLLEVIDLQEDSIRFYNLGNQYQSRIEHFGVKVAYDPGGVLML